MAEIIARMKVKGKMYEIVVDCDKAVAFMKGQPITMSNILVGNGNEVFFDAKKGIRVKEHELTSAFGTTNIEDIAKKIIMEGEVQLPAEYKAHERDNRLKQIIDFIATNCTDPKGMHHPPQRIEAALKQIHFNVQNKPIEEQIPEILKKLQTVIPLRIETKKLLIRVPAQYTGHLYGILKDYITSEEWLSDGSLSCKISLPSAVQMAFFDKINSLTHGTVITQEIKE